MARALYFQSRISIEFWSYCILSVVFLIIRTPSPLLKHQTPYQLLFKASSDYFSFRVFGCLAFASTLAAHRTKFQPRARVCVFIGYPPGIKGYKLYDVETKQVFFSRDVVFHEKIFPFHTVVVPFAHAPTSLAQSVLELVLDASAFPPDLVADSGTSQAAIISGCTTSFLSLRLSLQSSYWFCCFFISRCCSSIEVFSSLHFQASFL
ncbi:hypothetical protein JRO89_XS05G0038600 [Xanthoceras sorbifolium]|uniref:Retroviral polymerase SH3-like domain-containing protein n=1 Tax=Xanthoceras sorbifolium TaxID=99658 RepID=A0ABQ8I0S3_9ROSI|nr:hypothetical protein JRO89_XS05G0038600 [Xanthoceras sorbifolium]